jgi:hypothetical protein
MEGTYRKGNGGSLHVKKSPQPNLYELSYIIDFTQILPVLHYYLFIHILVFIDKLVSGYIYIYIYIYIYC